jgi:hypothetical protein
MMKASGPTLEADITVDISQSAGMHPAEAARQNRCLFYYAQKAGGVNNPDQTLVRDTGKVKDLRLGSQPQ